MWRRRRDAKTNSAALKIKMMMTAIIVDPERISYQPAPANVDVYFIYLPDRKLTSVFMKIDKNTTNNAN